MNTEFSPNSVPTHAGLVFDTNILNVSTVTAVVPVAIQPEPADEAVTVYVPVCDVVALFNTGSADADV